MYVKHESTLQIYTVISGFIGLTVPVSVVYSEMSEASQTRQEWESIKNHQSGKRK